jgi:hypothetical protein
MRCFECKASADRAAKGWRGYIVAGTRRKRPFVAFYCPACASREFGPLNPRRHGKPG